MVVGDEPMTAGVFFLSVHSLHKSDLLLHAVYYNLQKTDNRNE